MPEEDKKNNIIVEPKEVRRTIRIGGEDIEIGPGRIEPKPSSEKDRNKQQEILRNTYKSASSDEVIE